MLSLLMLSFHGADAPRPVETMLSGLGPAAADPWSVEMKYSYPGLSSLLIRPSCTEGW
jgi:hypothetical protein